MRKFWHWCLSIGIGVSVMGSVLAPYNPTFAEPAHQFQAPSAQHWLGLDQLGRDVLSRLLWGLHYSVAGAALAILIAMTLGGLFGVIGGLVGGYVDQAVVHVFDMLLALPGLLSALVVIAVVGQGILSVALAAGVALIPTCGRLIRSHVLDIKGQDYVEAARALGADYGWIMWRHVLPNLYGPLRALLVIVFSWALLNIAALDFLGLAGSPSLPTWGRMMNEGRAYLSEAPLIMLGPGIAMSALMLSAAMAARPMED